MKRFLTQYILIVSCFLSGGLSLCFGENILTGKLTWQEINAIDSIYIAGIQGSIKTPLLATEVKQNGEFRFQASSKLQEGIYILYLEHMRNGIEFYWNPAFSLTLNVGDSRFGAMETIGNIENEIYMRFLVIDKKHQRDKQQIRRSSKSAKSSEEKQALRTMLKENEGEYLKELSGLIQELPESSFLRTLLYSTQPEHASDPKLYLNTIPMQDERIIRSSILPKRLAMYIQRFGKSENHFLDLVDRVMQQAKANSAVYEVCAYELLKGFYAYQKPVIVDYILDTYVLGEDCGGLPVSDILRRKGEIVKNLRLGGTAPNIQAQSIKEKREDLSKTVAQHQYTILVFWASHCKSCDKQLPYMKKEIAQYKKEQVGVFSFSLDLSENAWKQKAEQIPGIHCSDLLGWDSPIVESYKIAKTPTWMVLDQNGEIVDQSKTIYETLDFLKNALQ